MTANSIMLLVLLHTFCYYATASRHFTHVHLSRRLSTTQKSDVICDGDGMTVLGVVFPKKKTECPFEGRISPHGQTNGTDAYEDILNSCDGKPRCFFDLHNLKMKDLFECDMDIEYECINSVAKYTRVFLAVGRNVSSEEVCDAKGMTIKGAVVHKQHASCKFSGPSHVTNKKWRAFTYIVASCENKTKCTFGPTQFRRLEKCQIDIEYNCIGASAGRGPAPAGPTTSQTLTSENTRAGQLSYEVTTPGELVQGTNKTPDVDDTKGNITVNIYILVGTGSAGALVVITLFIIIIIISQSRRAGRYSVEKTKLHDKEKRVTNMDDCNDSLLMSPILRPVASSTINPPASPTQSSSSSESRISYENTQEINNYMNAIKPNSLSKSTPDNLDVEPVTNLFVPKGNIKIMSKSAPEIVTLSPELHCDEGIEDFSHDGVIKEAKSKLRHIYANFKSIDDNKTISEATRTLSKSFIGSSESDVSVKPKSHPGRPDPSTDLAHELRLRMLRRNESSSKGTVQPVAHVKNISKDVNQNLPRTESCTNLAQRSPKVLHHKVQQSSPTNRKPKDEDTLVCHTYSKDLYTTDKDAENSESVNNDQVYVDLIDECQSENENNQSRFDKGHSMDNNTHDLPKPNNFYATTDCSTIKTKKSIRYESLPASYTEYQGVYHSLNLTPRYANLVGEENHVDSTQAAHVRDSYTELVDRTQAAHVRDSYTELVDDPTGLLENQTSYYIYWEGCVRDKGSASRAQDELLVRQDGNSSERGHLGKDTDDVGYAILEDEKQAEFDGDIADYAIPDEETYL